MVEATKNVVGTAHVSLGSQCAPVAFSDLQNECSVDSAFKDCCKKIGCFSQDILENQEDLDPAIR